MRPITPNNRREALYRLWSLLLLAALVPLPAAGQWLCSDGSRCLSCPSALLLPASPPAEACGVCPGADRSLSADGSFGSTDCRACCRYVMRESPPKLSSFQRDAYGSADAALPPAVLLAPPPAKTVRHGSTSPSLFDSHLSSPFSSRAPPLPA